jgi:DNA-binding NarL/FixJ family response regulator
VVGGQTPIRVLIADDDRLFRESVLSLFWREERIHVIGFASNGDEAVQRATLLRPDIVTMDLEMPVVDGVEATRLIAETLPETRVVIVSASEYAERAELARQAGAAAYVTKARMASALVQTILEVHGGAEFSAEG